MKKITLKKLLVKTLKKNHLLSVSDFLKLLNKDGRNYNKTSVYRSLEQLLEENVVCRHHLSNLEAKYELRDHHHAHLVCTECDEVVAGDCNYDQPERVGDFIVNHHHNTLFGLCFNCQPES
jgi:Fe2+ or Zn2+ uptake regulation protein